MINKFRYGKFEFVGARKPLLGHESDITSLNDSRNTYNHLGSRNSSNNRDNMWQVKDVLKLPILLLQTWVRSSKKQCLLITFNSRLFLAQLSNDTVSFNTNRKCFLAGRQFLTFILNSSEYLCGTNCYWSVTGHYHGLMHRVLWLSYNHRVRIVGNANGSHFTFSCTLWF